MKKAFVWVMMGILAVSMLAGCGKKETEPVISQPVEESVAEPEPEPEAEADDDVVELPQALTLKARQTAASNAAYFFIINNPPLYKRHFVIIMLCQTKV